MSVDSFGYSLSKKDEDRGSTSRDTVFGVWIKSSGCNADDREGKNDCSHDVRVWYSTCWMYVARFLGSCKIRFILRASVERRCETLSHQTCGAKDCDERMLAYGSNWSPLAHLHSSLQKLSSKNLEAFASFIYLIYSTWIHNRRWTLRRLDRKQKKGLNNLLAKMGMNSGLWLKLEVELVGESQMSRSRVSLNVI